MSKKSDSEGHAHQAEVRHSTLSFEERIAHLAAGYSHSQSVVQLLDTKAVAVIGCVPVVLGIVAAVFAWLVGYWQWERLIDITGLRIPIIFGVMMLGIAVMLLIFAWLSVAAAFNAISPQNTGDALPSILFPFQAGKPLNSKAAVPNEDFVSRASLFAGKASQSDAIEDYRRQIVRMSQIVARKLSYVRRAVAHLKRVFFFSAIALSVMLLMTGANGALAAYRYWTKEKAVPTTLPTSSTQTRPSLYQ